MSVPTLNGPSPRDLAFTFLRLAHDEFQMRQSNRAYFARVAKTHGLTNQEIADAYGITEGAVRAMLKRGA